LPRVADPLAHADRRGPDLRRDLARLQPHLQAASGQAAEDALDQAVEENWGNYLLLVDGSIPTGEFEDYSCTNGHSHLEMLKKYAAGAAAIVTIGTCAAYGGICRRPTRTRPRRSACRTSSRTSRSSTCRAARRSRP
jgi:Ni,Fe-hydrogenase I small subunit